MLARSQRQVGKQQQSIHLPLKKPKRYKFCLEINLSLSLFLSLSFATPLLQPLTPSLVYLFISSAEATTDTARMATSVESEEGGSIWMGCSFCSGEACFSGFLPGDLPGQGSSFSRAALADCTVGAGMEAVFSGSRDKPFQLFLPLCKSALGRS